MDTALSDEALTGIVEDPAEANRLFVRLRRQRNLISLRPATAQREYSSILLSLDTEHQYLVLDAPRPRAAEGIMRPGTKIYARSHVDGAPLILIATINALLDDDDDGDPKILLNWPSRISYFQRRRDYRVNVPATLMPAPARLLIDGHAVKARLIDLSASGAAVLIADELPELPEHAEYPCILPLPNADLQLLFRVRQTTRGRDGTRVGGVLLLADERDRQLILRAVMTIERWWLQQH